MCRWSCASFLAQRTWPPFRPAQSVFSRPRKRMPCGCLFLSLVFTTRHRCVTRRHGLIGQQQRQQQQRQQQPTLRRARFSGRTTRRLRWRTPRTRSLRRWLPGKLVRTRLVVLGNACTKGSCSAWCISACKCSTARPPTTWSLPCPATLRLWRIGGSQRDSFTPGPRSSLARPAFFAWRETGSRMESYTGNPPL